MKPTTLEKLFENIPSSTDVQTGLDEKTRKLVEAFSQRLALAIQGSLSTSFTLQTSKEERTLIGTFYWKNILEILGRKGWHIQHISDQRDGDYFQITTKQ